jgi:hypothetical protein
MDFLRDWAKAGIICARRRKSVKRPQFGRVNKAGKNKQPPERAGG